jgi:hypothetical protein
MRVTMLDGGAFTSALGIWREGESLGRQVRFPVPAYLVEVGEERILVDTGLHPDAAADAEAHYGGHAGGLELLPASVPVHLQRREWEDTSRSRSAAPS